MGSLIGLAVKFLGPRALKAVTSAVTTGGAAFAATCDVESALTQILTTGGAALAGYIATYIVPNKKDE